MKIQANSTIQNNPVGVQENLIPVPLKAFIMVVSSVALSIFSLLGAGLPGLAIGAIAGVLFSFAVIKVINNVIGDSPELSLPEELSVSNEMALTDLTDPLAAQNLVDFYKQCIQLEFNGPDMDQPKDIQTWMKTQCPEIRSCKSLNLDSLELKNLPREIRLFRNLETLTLRYSGLESLPAEIGDLKSLREVNVSRNQLESLPAEIGYLKSLTHLDVSFNTLNTLPSEIGDLQSLTNLNVSHNKLNTLPPQIGNLASLTTLGANSNNFEALPSEISGLQSLTVLEISHNKLNALPPEIAELQSLTDLYLSMNELEAIPLEQFDQLDQLDLTFLSFFGNPIQAVPIEIGNLGIQQFMQAPQFIENQ